MLSFLSALRKDAPVASDVHVSTALGGKKPKVKPFAAIIGQISPNAKLPVTGADLAAQQENPDDSVTPGQVGKADAPRALKPIDGETAHSPFPYDPNALSNIRPDQTPRFFGALTNPKDLETKTMSLSDLTAMQDRVDQSKVQSVRDSNTRKPPVVIGMNGRNYLADGHHRASAAWLDGKDDIKVKFKDLDPVDNALKAFAKRGARHSGKDRASIQAIHDNACALGADCDGSDNDDDSYFDDAVDQLGKRDGAWSIPFKIAKADADQQLIFGWASVVEKDGRLIIDKQGDAITPEDLEKAAYDFALNARAHGHMHEQTGTGRMVESMVFTKEKQAALGIDLGKVGWWIGFKVDHPETWAAHKRGELPEFSIGGTGRRVAI